MPTQENGRCPYPTQANALHDQAEALNTAEYLKFIDQQISEYDAAHQKTTAPWRDENPTELTAKQHDHKTTLHAGMSMVNAFFIQLALRGLGYKSRR